jgi:hypothetical protein
MIKHTDYAEDVEEKLTIYKISSVELVDSQEQRLENTLDGEEK